VGAPVEYPREIQRRPEEEPAPTGSIGLAGDTTALVELAAPLSYPDVLVREVQRGLGLELVFWMIIAGAEAISIAVVFESKRIEKMMA
jgi:hypothetical protein